MEHKLFCFWLDGFFKGLGEKDLADEKINLIRQQLLMAMSPAVTVTNWYDENGQPLNRPKKPDYYIGGSPPFIPMYDQYNEDGTKKERLIC